MSSQPFNLVGYVFSLILFLCTASASCAVTITELLNQTLAEALPANCSEPRPLDTLQKILCEKRINIGVRSDYPSMSVRDGNAYIGYEADLTKLIAKRLGVEVRETVVTPGTRIEKLLKGEVDLILATMSHTTARDKIVTFITPHYHSSPSSIFGTALIPVSVLTDLHTQTICVPLGTFFTAILAENNIRMIIYDKPDRLVDAVLQGSCRFIAHDQTFLNATFASKYSSPLLKDIVVEKIAFLDVPTGMGVRNDDISLAVAIGQIMAELHQSGVLIQTALKHDVNPSFLEKQQKLWNTPACAPVADGLPIECLGKPANLSDRASVIANFVKKLEESLDELFGIEFSMPMLSGQIALKFFLSGLENSLIICAGGFVAVLLFAMLFFSLVRSTNGLVRNGSLGVILVFQNTPLILLFVLGAICLSAIGAFSPAKTIFMSIIVIGLSNGANASMAMRDVLRSGLGGADASLKAVFIASRIQIRGCLVNAARGSPVASFVGTPELLSVMVNITAFTGTRASTYLFMIIFYLISIQLVFYVFGKICTYVMKSMAVPVKGGATP